MTTETPKPNDNPDGEEIEENAFGRKVRRKKKKMETRLLKEILNDVKVSSKRYWFTSFNRAKIGEKCQNWKIQMRHFE